MVAQTNDTDLHEGGRKRFIEKQTAMLMTKARIAGGGLVDLSKEENMDIMIDVMSDTQLHLNAVEGYRRTGTTVALDVTEDHKIKREAADFWNELDVRDHVNSAVADVEARYRAKTLDWTYELVQSLIMSYPKKGHLPVVTGIS